MNIARPPPFIVSHETIEAYKKAVEEDKKWKSIYSLSTQQLKEYIS